MPTWLPWLLLALTAVVGGFLLWYYVAGGVDEDEVIEGVDPLSVTAAEDRAKDPFSTTTEEYRGAARKSRMIALRQSLERSLDAREGVRGSTKDRMIMPWFMLVGADGSGKKTILANNGLELPWGPPIEVDSVRKDAGKWWLYDEAVVLEAPAASPGTTDGSSTLPPDQTVADASLGWSTLLHMLRRERPDSPLNGIIVAIACGDLIGARLNSDRMEEQADRIRTFLERTRKFLGVRLPLHVLVTKCDALPGFRSFTEALPESRRQDIFGWSNPNDPEARFEPGWVDTGFAELEGQLGNLRDEVLAAPEQVRDSVGVFVFDSEFSDLQEPLKAFVARLMPIGERRPSLFFRGFYFTGDAIAPHLVKKPEPTASGKMKSDTRISAEIAQEPHNLVFLKALFAEKIFKEAGLARAAAKLRLARDRRVVLAQAAAIIIALGGGLGLYTSVNGLQAADGGSAGIKRDALLLTRVLSGVAIDLDELRRGSPGNGGSVRRTRDAAVLELVGQMREVPSVEVRSPFIPTSWFSRLPSEIRASMAAGVRDIVLPVTRQRLMERAAGLMGTGSAVTTVPDELDPADPRSVPRYLDEVRVLSRNIARYNSLADSTTGSFDELSALLEYLFGERMLTDSSLATPDFEDALRSAAGQPIPVSSGMAAAVIHRAVAVVSAVAGSASRQLSPRYSEAAERAIRPIDDLRALHGLGALVELLDDTRGVLATVGDSTILGMSLGRAVRDSIAAQVQVAAVRIAPDTLAPDSSARRLRNVIGQLYSFRLMRPIEGRHVTSEIKPNERLRWDVGSLELALTLQSEFLQAVVTTAAAFPGQSPERLRRALELQLRDRAVDVAATAQRFTPLGDVEDTAEVKAQGLNLEGAASRIVRVATMLDSLGAGPEGQRLVASGVRQAEQVLALAQARLDRNRPLAPVGPSIAAWQGVLPFAFAALGTTDSLPFHTALLRQEIEVRALAHSLVPTLRFLRLGPVADSVEARDLLDGWEQIVTGVLKYERGDLTSTMGALHRFLVSDLMVHDLPRCRALAERSDDGGSSTDFFVMRRSQFQAALRSRCIPGRSADAVAEYHRMRAYFQARLAGRYPFANPATPARVDAVTSDVRDFLRQYDQFARAGDIALRSDPRLAQTGRAAMTFLDQFAPVRAFLGPVVGSGSERPTYGLTVAARGLVDTLPLALLEVRVGARQIGLEEAPQPIMWRSGDSVNVVITPFDTATARSILAAGGPWAAFRFAQQSGSVDARLYHPQTRTELPLPVFPVTAPEVLILRQR
jgi:type VI secretion system protein ImpL